MNTVITYTVISNAHVFFMSLCLLLALGVEDNMQEVVGHVTEGVCRPLKVSNHFKLLAVCASLFD